MRSASAGGMLVGGAGSSCSWRQALAAATARWRQSPRTGASRSSTPSSTTSEPCTTLLSWRWPTAAWPVSSFARCAPSVRDQRGLGVPDSGTRTRAPTRPSGSGSPRAFPVIWCVSDIGPPSVTFVPLRSVSLLRGGTETRRRGSIPRSGGARERHELGERRLDALGHHVEVRERVVVAEQSDADPAVVGHHRDRERPLPGQER